MVPLRRDILDHFRHYSFLVLVDLISVLSLALPQVFGRCIVSGNLLCFYALIAMLFLGVASKHLVFDLLDCGFRSCVIQKGFGIAVAFLGLSSKIFFGRL